MNNNELLEKARAAAERGCDAYYGCNAIELMPDVITALEAATQPTPDVAALVEEANAATCYDHRPEQGGKYGPATQEALIKVCHKLATALLAADARAVRAELWQKQQDFLAEQLRQQLGACREQLLVLANENDSLQGEHDALAARLAEADDDRMALREIIQEVGERCRKHELRADAADALAVQLQGKKNLPRLSDDTLEVIDGLRGWNNDPKLLAQAGESQLAVLEMADAIDAWKTEAEENADLIVKAEQDMALLRAKLAEAERERDEAYAQGMSDTKLQAEHAAVYYREMCARLWAAYPQGMDNDGTPVDVLVVRERDAAIARAEALRAELAKLGPVEWQVRFPLRHDDTTESWISTNVPERQKSAGNITRAIRVVRP